MSSRAAKRKRLPNAALGLIVVALVAAGLYLSFAKSLPWSGAYEIEAVFRDAQNVAVNSPVRSAGVNIGKVTAVDALPSARGAVVTMEVGDQGRPIRKDARFQLRPRLFLEGSLFVEVQPGSPGAGEAPDGFQFPMAQTAASVQLDQVLSTLQAPVRANLQILLRELRAALESGGAAGLRTFYRTGGSAFRHTSRVAEALTGTEPHDLSELVGNFDRVAIGLGRHEGRLRGLVTSLRTVAGSLADQETALRASIRELPLLLETSHPALANLNDSLPFVRAFAREALPGVRGAAPAVEEATPLLRQLRALVSEPELRGLTADLRPTVPPLAQLSRASVPFLEEARALAGCFNHTIIPWSQDTVPDVQLDPAGEIHKELGYLLTGLGGVTRSGDANGQWVRVLAGLGLNSLSIALPGSGTDSAGIPLLPVLGVQPAVRSSAKTPFRPEVPCETQELPDLRARVGAPPLQTPLSPDAGVAGRLNALSRDYAARLQTVREAGSGPGAQAALKDLVEFSRRGGAEEYFRTLADLGLREALGG